MQGLGSRLCWSSRASAARNSGPRPTAELVARAGGVLADLARSSCRGHAAADGSRSGPRMNNPATIKTRISPHPTLSEHGSQSTGQRPIGAAPGEGGPDQPEGVGRGQGALLQSDSSRPPCYVIPDPMRDTDSVGGRPSSTGTVSPGFRSRTATTSSSAPAIGRSATLTMTSPSTMPGDGGRAVRGDVLHLRPVRCPVGDRAGIHPEVGVAHPPVRISLGDPRAVSIGIAKPSRSSRPRCPTWRRCCGWRC